MQQTQVNEDILLQRLTAGDGSALDTLYRHYWEKLFLFAFNILQDKPACEDLIQDVFVRLWANRAKLNIQLSLRAYLFASCRYALYRHIKSGRARADLFDNIYDKLQPGQDTEWQLEHRELLAAVQSVIDGLPPKCREVFLLSRQEQLTYAAIAQRLGISARTVENHMHRALKELRETLTGLLTMELLFLLFDHS